MAIHIFSRDDGFPPKDTVVRKNPNGGCSDVTYDRPNAYWASTRNGLMARLSQTSLTLPSSPLISDKSQFYVGVFGSGQLPELKPLAATSRIKTRTVDYRKRVANGEIIINPMRTSTLAMSDKYVPVNPTGAAYYNFIGESLRSDPEPHPCFPWSSVFRFQGELRSAQPQVGTYQALNYVARYAICTQVRRQSDLFGFSTNTIQAVKRGLDAYYDDLLRDSGLITKVVGDTRAGTYDILTDVAEARSTFQLIMSCVIRILTEFRNVKARIARRPSLDPRRRKSIWSESADEWMQFRYAITPTLLSLDSALKWMDDNNMYAKFRGTLTRSVEEINLYGIVITPPPPVDRVFGKIRVDGLTSGLKINPLATALELVPLSFLLNWVCNIGDLVSALWPPSGAQQEVYSYSRSVPPRTPVTGKYEDQELSFMYGYYRNDIIDPIQDLALQLDLSLSWKRVIDAFALVYRPLRSSIYS